jgi:hypothetical protein
MEDVLRLALLKEKVKKPLDLSEFTNNNALRKVD